MALVRTRKRHLVPNFWQCSAPSADSGKPKNRRFSRLLYTSWYYILSSSSLILSSFKFSFSFFFRSSISALANSIDLLRSFTSPSSFLVLSPILFSSVSRLLTDFSKAEKRSKMPSRFCNLRAFRRSVPVVKRFFLSCSRPPELDRPR